VAYDVVVIGADPASEVIAGELAEGGLSVAVAEEDLVGGECSYYACMPAKALLRSSDIRAEVSRVTGVAEPNPDVGAVLARDAVVHDLDDTGQRAWLVQRGVSSRRGHAERRVRGGAVGVEPAHGWHRSRVADGGERHVVHSEEALACEQVSASLTALERQRTHRAPRRARPRERHRATPTSQRPVGGRGRWSAGRRRPSPAR